MSAQEFPTTFAATLDRCVPVHPENNSALVRLEARGLAVFAGMTTELVPVINQTANQPHIRDAYCPNDVLDSRFETVASTSG